MGQEWDKWHVRMCRVRTQNMNTLPSPSCYILASTGPIVLNFGRHIETEQLGILDKSEGDAFALAHVPHAQPLSPTIPLLYLSNDWSDRAQIRYARRDPLADFDGQESAHPHVPPAHPPENSYVLS